MSRDKITHVIKCFRSLRADHDESGEAEYGDITMDKVEKINSISDVELVMVDQGDLKAIAIQTKSGIR